MPQCKYDSMHSIPIYLISAKLNAMIKYIVRLSIAMQRSNTIGGSANKRDVFGIADSPQSVYTTRLQSQHE